MAPAQAIVPSWETISNESPAVAGSHDAAKTASPSSRSGGVATTNSAPELMTR